MFHRSVYAAIFSLIFAALVAYLMRTGYEPMRTIVYVIAGLLALDALIFLVRQLVSRR